MGGGGAELQRRGREYGWLELQDYLRMRCLDQEPSRIHGLEAGKNCRRQSKDSPQRQVTTQDLWAVGVMHPEAWTLDATGVFHSLTVAARLVRLVLLLGWLRCWLRGHAALPGERCPLHALSV